MSRIFLIFACIFIQAFIVAACGTDTGQDPTAAGEITIYRGNGGDPGSLDPALAEDVHAFNILADLYEGLVTTAADGTLVPGAAERWSVSADGLTYRFHLRTDALWSNGEPVTAEDFVRAYERVTAPSSTAGFAFLLDPVRDYVAVGPSTLEIHLAEPAAHLPAVLSMPVAFPIPASAIAAGSFSDPESFVGNGPYLLDSHTVGAATRLRRNPSFRDVSSVAVDVIVYLPIVDPLAELNIYRSGELHITNTIPPGHLPTLGETIPDALRIAPSLALYYLAFDLTEPPLDNPALRQALSMAIDRRQLVELIGRGEQPAYGVVPTGVANYDGAAFEWRDWPSEKRESRARELYRQAGYDRSAPLTIHYTYDAGDIHEKVALAVVSMWRDILGVEVTLDKKEWQYFLETRERRSDWQVMRFAWFGDYDHASTFTNIFRSNDAQNLARFDNPEYDRLVATASQEAHSDKQAELLREAEALLLTENPVAPLYFFVSKHLVSPQVAGFEQNVLDRHPSRYLSLEVDD